MIKDKIKNMFEFKILEKGLEFNILISKDVPTQLYGDEKRLLQILINLVNNAIKFTEHGKIDIHIRLDEQRNQKVFIYFSITDTGIGISEQEREKLFKPFSQAYSSKNYQFEGTGLGLAISKKLVELMNGEIDFISEKGKGTTFWFVACFEKIQNDNQIIFQNTIIKNDKKSLDIKNNNNDKRILIVDDNFINCNLAKHFLKKASYSSNIANNGKQALEILEKETYDLVLMDIQMPVLDGISATKIIRDTNSAVIDHNVPIIAITANAMAGDSKKYLEAGMDYYLSKPFKYNNFINVIAKALNEKNPQSKPINESSSNKKNITNDKKETLFLDYNKSLSYISDDKDLWKQLAKEFMIDIPARINNLSILIKEKNFKDAELESHTIKSTSDILGASPMQKIALKMELCCSKNQVDYLPVLLKKIENLYEKTKVEILKRISV